MNGIIKKGIAYLSITALFLLLVSCSGGNKKYDLSLEYSEWTDYRFIYSSTGVFESEDSTFNAITRISLRVSIKKDSSGEALLLRAAEPDINSNIMDSSDIKNLTKEITEKEFRLNPATNQGDSFRFLQNIPGEWDIHHHLHKVWPTLPSSSVSKGFEWERNPEFPVKTTKGVFKASMYQLFKVDSITPDSSAFINWSYRYLVSSDEKDTVPQNLPKKANGEGKAILDIPKGKLIKTEAAMESEKRELEGTTIQWKDTISLTLIDDDQDEDEDEEDQDQEKDDADEDESKDD